MLQGPVEQPTPALALLSETEQLFLRVRLHQSHHLILTKAMKWGLLSLHFMEQEAEAERLHTCPEEMKQGWSSRSLTPSNILSLPHTICLRTYIETHIQLSGPVSFCQEKFPCEESPSSSNYTETCGGICQYQVNYSSLEKRGLITTVCNSITCDGSDRSFN